MATTLVSFRFLIMLNPTRLDLRAWYPVCIHEERRGGEALESEAVAGNAAFLCVVEEGRAKNGPYGMGRGALPGQRGDTTARALRRTRRRTR